ncbi:MAG: PorP/SprF family type IX secretion system membrane protein [Saprospiraceae bacterium]
MQQKYIFTFAFLYVFGVAIGQQIPNSTHITETRAYWNPALIAPNNDIVFDALFRMQWIGFNGAPMSGFISYQNPLKKTNTSIGGGLNFDKTGPVSKVGLQLNYAYKLKQLANRYDQFSMGLSAHIQQYSFNGSNEIFNDDDDPLILNNRSGSFFPSFGGGFYYISDNRMFKKNAFFAGAAIQQGLTTKVLINDFDQQRVRHYNFNLGARLVRYETYLEPMVTVNMVSPQLVDVLYSLKLEQENTFWSGIGYSSASMVALQGGVIVNDFGQNNARLRIGALATYGLGSTISTIGPSFELYIGYFLKN